MRLSLDLLPLLLLVALPFQAAWSGWGLAGVTLAALAVFALRCALVLNKPLLDKEQLRSPEANKIVLESLPVSHYVEKVR